MHTRNQNKIAKRRKESLQSGRIESYLEAEIKKERENMSFFNWIRYFFTKTPKERTLEYLRKRKEHDS